MIATVAKYSDYVSECFEELCWADVSDIPASYFYRVFAPDEDLKRCDVITPLMKGKEWLFELTSKWQPETARHLLEGDLFVIHAMQRGPRGAPKLCLNLKGRILVIGRRTHGMNCCDDGYVERARKFKIRRENSLPLGIKEAYYWRFDGLDAPERLPVGIDTRLLPFPIGRPWQSWDGYLEEFRGFKKKYLRWLEEIIPDVRPEKGMPYTKFMMFLDTRPTLSGKEGDVFFVKNHIQDGKVYWIHDADITGMRELSDPVTAIDLYCAHVLSGNLGRFDFREFSRPL